MSIPVGQLEKLRALIHDRFALDSRRLPRLEQRAAERVAELRLPDWSSYLDLVRRDRRELDDLVGSVTTRETRFFRLPAQFEALTALTLPSLEEELGRRAQVEVSAGRQFPAESLSLRAWSAGCATGEEAWSLAMAVLGGLRFPRAWRVSILATDLSREALQVAASGVYPVSAMQPVPRQYRLFRNERQGLAEMGPALRRLVDFRVHNLREVGPDTDSLLLERLDGPAERRPAASAFDLIFCRNVMIYFDVSDQQRLVDGLDRCLRPGGWLFTGDAELLNIHRHRFRSVNFPAACVYRKPLEDQP